MKQNKKIFLFHTEDFEFEARNNIVVLALAEKFNLKIIHFYNPFYEFILRGKSVYFRNTISKYKNFFKKNCDLHTQKTKRFAFSWFALIYFISLCNLKFNNYQIKNILSFKFKGLNFGKVIYNTLLRNFHLPTIENLNYNNRKAVSYIMVELKFLNIFFSILKIDLVISPDCTYVQNGGIICKLASVKKIETYLTTGELPLIKFDPSFPNVSRNFRHFKNTTIIDKDKIKKYREVFSRKFSSNELKDNSLYYMRTNAYASSKVFGILEIFEGHPKNIVIFLHDFFDAYYCYNDEIFQDYFVWIKEICEYLIENNKNNFCYYFKLHPNSYPQDGSWELSRELINSFECNNFKIIEPDVSNNEILNAKPDLVVSMRGTIGFETPFFGLKTVLIGDNPFVNFNFAYICKTKEEYMEILIFKKIINIRLDINDSLNELYSYYDQAYDVRDNNCFYELLNARRKIATSNLSYNFYQEFLEIYHQNKIQINKDILNSFNMITK
jgi:hypothetical protein